MASEMIAQNLNEGDGDASPVYMSHNNRNLERGSTTWSQVRKNHPKLPEAKAELYMRHRLENRSLGSLMTRHRTSFDSRPDQRNKFLQTYRNHNDTTNSSEAPTTTLNNTRRSLRERHTSTQLGSMIGKDLLLSRNWGTAPTAAAL